MTTGGKIMTGVGVGVFVVGMVGVVGTAAVGGWASSSDKAKLYGAGGGAVAGGVTLVILGDHRRSAK